MAHGRTAGIRDGMKLFMADEFQGFRTGLRRPSFGDIPGGHGLVPSHPEISTI